MDDALVTLVLLWPITGWVLGYVSTPKWMFDDDWFGYVLLFFCGAVVGPFGIFWCFDKNSTFRDGNK